MALACTPNGAEPWLKPAELDAPIQRVGLAYMGGVGLSGTALDGSGRMWAIAERQRVMIAIERPFARQLRVRKLVVRGVPDDLEPESLAWLGDNRFAIGTERHDRASGQDQILFAHVIGDEVIVSSKLTLDYRALWNIVAPANQGVEGLCHAGGQLVAAAEPVVRLRGRRFAPLARRAQGDADWVAYLVALTTPRGKLAGLDCQLSADGQTLDVVAIERHYGTTRLLRFALPTRGDGGRVRTTVLVDLSQRFPQLPNLEGIVRSGQRFLLVTDHDSPDEAGTTESILLGPFDSDDELEEAEPDD